MEKKNLLRSNHNSFIIKKYSSLAGNKFYFLSGILVYSFFAFFALTANAEEPAAAEKEAAGESEDGEKSEKGGEFIKKDEFLELNSAVEQLGAKVKSKNENLKKLLTDKDHIKEPEAFKDIVKQIETEYREIKEVLDNIEQKKIILRHRFPERSFVKSGDKAKEEKEDEVVMDSVIEKRVNQLLKLVESQYKGSILPKKLETSEDPNRSPASNEKTTATEPNNNPEDFSRSLHLKK